MIYLSIYKYYDSTKTFCLNYLIDFKDNTTKIRKLIEVHGGQVSLINSKCSSGLSKNFIRLNNLETRDNQIHKIDLKIFI